MQEESFEYLELPDEPQRSFIAHKGYPRVVFEVINTDGLSQEDEIKIKRKQPHASLMVHDYHLIIALVDFEIAALVDDDDFHDILQVAMKKACKFVADETLKYLPE